MRSYEIRVKRDIWETDNQVGNDHWTHIYIDWERKSYDIIEGKKVYIVIDCLVVMENGEPCSYGLALQSGR